MEAAGGDSNPCLASWRGQHPGGGGGRRWGQRDALGASLRLCGASWGPSMPTPLPNWMHFSVGAAEALVGGGHGSDGCGGGCKTGSHSG